MDHFAISYGSLRPLLVGLRLGPRHSGVDVAQGILTIRMGWAFRASPPIASISAVERDAGRIGGIGVHGGRGNWLINGSTSGIVRIDFDPPKKARVVGARVQLKSLRLSLDDPDSFLSALRT